ncbi:MAG: methionyl-tRNA formyltransferase [Ferruginibacter sp.]
MELRALKIIFMGTPEFAVASLDKLVTGGCNIVAVVTAPDKPAGRGLQLQQSAVKQYAVAKGLNVLQPEKLKDPVFLETLRSLQADLQVVVAFRMLPEAVWNMPPMGTINLHGSLLPQYRGAAPINWAIINGEKETGVTTFKLQHEIDTGNILCSARIPIREDETAGELHDEMKEAGAIVLLQTLEQLAAGTVSETPQSAVSAGAIKMAPKIHTDTCRILWDRPVDEIYNLIRGLSPYPAAFTFLKEKKLKIFSATKQHGNPSSAPGAYETDQRTYLRFAGPDGYLQVNELQLEGKKRMPIADFLRGYHF